MRWTSGLSRYLTQLLILEWKKNHTAEWNTANEEKIYSHIHHIIYEDLKKEKDLEKEVNTMLDQLEKTHSGQFDRYKMYPLLKAKMAKEKGLIL